MKLVFAIVQDAHAPEVLAPLLAAGHRATRIASTGGFLATGNSTLLVVCADDRVEEVIAIVRNAIPGNGEVPAGPRRGGGVIFAVPVDRFERL